MDYSFEPQHIDIIKRWLQSGSINIFGRPFAGKDTQGRALSDLFDGPLLGGGDILRNSVIPERSRAALHKGELVPIDEYLEIVLPYLSQDAFKGKPLFLSSVGRWHGEEAGVLAAAEQSGHPIKAVFYLDISEEETRARRAKSQEAESLGERGDRSDDTVEIFEVRLKEFREKTMPVIEYYETLPLFTRVDASRPAVEVTAQIIEVLLGYAQAS